MDPATGTGQNLWKTQGKPKEKQDRREDKDDKKLRMRGKDEVRMRGKDER